MLMKAKRYKDTEIGKIPEEWKVVKIKDIGKVLTGKTPSTSNSMYWNGNFPFITPVDIKEAKYVYETERHVSPQGAQQIGHILPKDTVLVVCIGSTIGKTGVTYTKSVTNQQINAIICNDKTNSHYVYYALSFRTEFLKSFSGVAAVPIIKKSLFEHFSIPLPPLPEQKKIAEILSTVDRAIEKVDEDIEKTQRLKKGLMQELLTKGIGHKEFKNTEMGRIPREWEILNLSEVFRLASGKSRPSEISDIQTEKMLYPIYGGNGILGYTNQSMINKETIVIGRVGEYCGSIHKTTKFSWITDNALYATNVLNHNLNLDFLTYWLTFLNLNKFKKESGQPLMTQTIVYSIKFPLPPLSEQKKIAEILSTVDKRLELLRKKKEKLERVKKGLMNDLLSGKSRVTNLISKEVKR